MKTRDSYYLARKIAKWIISHNNSNKVCTTNDIKEVAKHVYGEEASRRTVEEVKNLLTREGSVNLKDREEKETFKGVYSFKQGQRADAFKQYLRDRGIAFEPSEDGERVVFVVPKADEAVDRRANEIVRTLKDAENKKYEEHIKLIEKFCSKKVEPEELDKLSKGDLSYLLKNLKEIKIIMKDPASNLRGPSKTLDTFNNAFRNIKGILEKINTIDIKEDNTQDLKGIIIYPASEHKEFEGTYYGYVSVEHPTLGEFYVSVEAFGKKVQTDGTPWNFLKDAPLTNEQVEWVKENEKDLKKAMRRGSKVVLNDSKADIKDKDIEEVILDSINHFKNDLGVTPEVSDIIDDLLANYDIIDEEETPELTDRLYKEIALVARRNNITLRDKKSRDSFAMLKVGDSDLDIPSIIEKEIRSLGGRDRQADYEKVIASIEPKKDFPNVYEFMPSYGLTLAEKQMLAKSLRLHKELEVYGGPYFIVALKEQEQPSEEVKEKAKERIAKIIKDPRYVSTDNEGVEYLYNDAYKMVEKIAKEAGLKRSEMKELHPYMFGDWGYPIGIKDSNDPLSEENLNALFKKFKGDEDKVLDELRKLELDIPNGDLQGVVEAHKMTFKDSEETNQYQELLKLLSGSYPQEFGLEPFLYDAMSEYKDFVSLYEVLEGQEELPEKPLVVLTYLFNELEDEKDNWEERLKADKKRLEYMYELKEMNSPEPEDAKYLIVGLLKNDSRPKEVKIGDIGLTRKQKIWYAEELSKSVDPKFLRRNYRLKRIKGERKK